MKLLAKSTGEGLAEHTVRCIDAAEALIAGLPLAEEEARRVGEDVLLAVALHDVGKAATGFQAMVGGDRLDWGGKRHEILSAAFASEIGLSEAALLAILTHHKGIPGDGITASGIGCLPFEQLPLGGQETPVWQEMKAEWLANAERLAEAWRAICQRIRRPELADGAMILHPLALREAWFSRSAGRNGQRRAISYAERLHASVVRGLTIAADHLGSAHRKPPAIPRLEAFRVLDKKPRPFQSAIGGFQGSAILRAPTGSGKTEAAILWAQQNQARNGRLFYVLPYTASINAMYTRLGRGSERTPGVFGEENVGLVHSRAMASLYSMLEHDGDLSSCLGTQGRAKGLADLARQIWFPIRVCTPHQVLRYFLRGKGWEAGLAEFPRACFVFDEVHAYDARLVGLLLASARLARTWGAKCLFMSATLPAFLEGLIREALECGPALAPNPAEPEDEKVLERRRHRITVRPGTILQHIDIVATVAGETGSTLVVCNHVKTAQTVYEALKGRLGKNVLLLHGRFTTEDRNSIEAKAMRSPLPKVLVSTQVIEVSLNLDFDQGFMEPAPIDALVQRLGRVNRFGAREPAPVVVFTEQVNRYQLYCECAGAHVADCRVNRSLDELRSLAGAVDEGDLVAAADRVYGAGWEGEDGRHFEEGRGDPDLTEWDQRLLAGAHRDWVEEVVKDGTVEVLPEGLVAEHSRRVGNGLWIAANMLLVPVRARSLAGLGSDLDKSKTPWVIRRPYSSETGLQL